MKKIDYKNLNLKESQDFIKKHHRHSKPLKRHMFSIGALNDQGDLVGVVTVDNCSSGGWSKVRSYKEIRRLCILPEADPNTASFLINKATTALFAMGYKAVITYTLPEESGSSLKGAGFNIYKRSTMRYVDGNLQGGKYTWYKTTKNTEQLDEERRFTNDCIDNTKKIIHMWEKNEKLN
tara:strand:+ start:95 stop:631 length:537 start_codon:yes stop_codon:yes gene_type:complete